MALHPENPITISLQRAIDDAAEKVKTAEWHLHGAIRNARERGMTWAQVGQALGVTKQAAQQRYGGDPAGREEAPDRHANDEVDGPAESPGQRGKRPL